MCLMICSFLWTINLTIKTFSQVVSSATLCQSNLVTTQNVVECGYRACSSLLSQTIGLDYRLSSEGCHMRFVLEPLTLPVISSTGCIRKPYNLVHSWFGQEPVLLHCHHFCHHHPLSFSYRSSGLQLLRLFPAHLTLILLGFLKQLLVLRSRDGVVFCLPCLALDARILTSSGNLDFSSLYLSKRWNCSC